MLDFLNEQLGFGLRRRSVGDQFDDAGYHGLARVTGDHQMQYTRSVHGAGEHLVTAGLGHRHRFTGDRALVDVASPRQHRTVCGYPVPRPHHHPVPHHQLAGRHHPFAAVALDHHRLIRREVQQAFDRFRGVSGGNVIQRTGRGEDHDQQRAVEDLPNRDRSDRRGNHQQIHIKCLVPQRLCARPCRAPAAGQITGQVKRPPHGLGSTVQLRH